ncbi:MAG: hypothetical protein NTV77_00985, partial [Candidatus Azambacteria bacterium]|nr:hypothetical protein [Candidatus Azambacteria bacterium]
NGKGFRITISQTNYEVLNAIKVFTGIGYIIKVTKRKEHWKDEWVYYIAKQSDVYKFLKGTRMFLIVKKDLAEKTLPKLNEILRQQELKKKIYIQRKQRAKVLRLRGLSYREIGKRLKTDWGYVRRLVLDLK